jgi:membrane-bound lytic murein transglycosylase
MRMAYAAQNGWKWSSLYPQIRDRGAASATKQGVCDWLGAQTPEQVRAAMNLDPSYVFFALEPIGDPRLGPKGAQGVPLTALGSAAIDPSAHPYGAPLFIAGGRSEYVQSQHRAEIERLFPAATIEIIPEAGHWVHADAPAAFLATVNRFLTA